MKYLSIDSTNRKSSVTIFSVSDKFLYIAKLPKSLPMTLVGRLQQETLYKSLKCPPKLGYISMGDSSTPSRFPSASDKKIVCEGLTVLCETKRNETKRYFAKWYFAKRLHKRQCA